MSIYQIPLFIQNAILDIYQNSSKDKFSFENLMLSWTYGKHYAFVPTYHYIIQHNPALLHLFLNELDDVLKHYEDRKY